VEFCSGSSEALREAKEWTCNMLMPSKTKTIKNNHVIHFGQEDHEYLLSLQPMLNVRIEEFFRNGNGGITITGNPSDVSCAAIEVENMLCKAQENFSRDEERDILYSVVRWSCKDAPWIQTPEIKNITEDAVVIKGYNGMPLHWLLQVEKLENIALKQLFIKNSQRVEDKPKRLYQRVSAQFCDLICRVGFQKEVAPPPEQKCGSGIYFSTVDEVLKLWNDQEHEQYIYIIQAQVLTGNSMDGSPHLIMPPPLSKDPLDRYDSVNHRKQTYVIFNGQQALPEYLFICAKQTLAYSCGLIFTTVLYRKV
uniref:PARP14-like eighth type I KH domain-containing protein n=1 Tax=Cyprinus carpio TaxID=7962 RepID=A0A8C2ACX0_CYPCA